MDHTNALTLQGRIVTEPELRIFDNDKKVCKFRFCHQVRRRLESGTYETVYEAYYDVEVWGHPAMKVAQLPKAAPVLVLGRLWSDEWNDRETGAKRSKPIIKADAVFIDLYGIRDVESGQGYLNLSWGRKDRTPPVPTGLEKGIGNGGAWDEEPF